MDIFETFTIIGTPVSIVGVAWGFLIYLPSKRQQEHDRAKDKHHHDTVEKQQESEAHRIKVEQYFIKELEEKKIDLAQKEHLLAEMTKKYEELEKSYQDEPKGNDLVDKAMKQVFNLDFASAMQNLKLAAIGKQELQKTYSKKVDQETVEEASIHAKMGLIAELQIDYQEAQTHFAKAVELSPENRNYLWKYGEILDIFGEYDLAQVQYNKVLPLVISQEEKGRILNDLGVIYSKKANYNLAISHWQEALSIFSQTLIPDHPFIGATYNNLGNAYCNMGEHNKAIEFHQKSLTISVQSHGEDHPSTGTCYFNLGGVYGEKGDYGKAIDYYHKDLAICIKNYGDEHPSTGDSFINLGNIFVQKGEYERAIEFYKKGLIIRVKTLGEEHPETARGYYNFSIALYNRSDYPLALDYAQRALGTRKNKLPKNHPDIEDSQKLIKAIKATIAKQE